jgi:RimJ/RimL family protein N-acetyltransferase
MINIRTDRLIIRLAKSEDAEAIYSYRSDLIENKYQGWFPDSVKEVSDYINNMPETIDVADICFQVAIIGIDEKRLIGDMGIVFTNYDNSQAEIGCTLHKDYQGKGYATEALKAMVNYLFVTLNKHRVVASIDPRNITSIQLIERLGFRKEAHFKESYYLRGEWVDDIIYAMLQTEWINDTKMSSISNSDPKSIALQFNECITNADLNGLVNLMTEDHLFIDTANNRIRGKDNNKIQAWEPFFNLYPGYRNIFENIVVRGSNVIMQGYSICSDEILNNVHAIWVTEIINDKVALWHIYPDTKENREIFNL